MGVSSGHRLSVVVRRGAIAESRHRVHAVAVDATGETLFETAPGGVATTFRSAAKPFQLLPLVERGHAERWGWSDEQLAIMAASHTGSPTHIALVTGILERLGRTDRDLACGYHDPLDAESMAKIRAGAPASALYNNCSGKHAGMLCLAMSEGWPIEGYEGPEHPLQVLMRTVVAECAGLAAKELSVAVDGCAVSVFGLPLARMARAYARLANASADGDPRSRALARIRRAMQAHPQAMGGAARLGTAIVEATNGRLLSKGGAEGLECLTLPGGGGLAVKCEDGNARALGPAVIGVLARLEEIRDDERASLADWEHPVVRNVRGQEVGRLEAIFEPAPVERPAARLGAET